MVPTEPDEALGSLLDLTVGTAVCQMFGRVPPAAADPATRSGTTLLDRATRRL